ncbi:MAG TPA: hypothetical protein VH595_17080 [Verrucomicrobiae bacterium]|nr:hypothetical protein [Verrucomicrobiae bacterium]
MFAAATPQEPMTVAARNTATVNGPANDGPLNFHRSASANAQLSVDDSSHTIWTM